MGERGGNSLAPGKRSVLVDLFLLFCSPKTLSHSCFSSLFQKGKESTRILKGLLKELRV